MKHIPFPALACPLDGLTLSRSGNSAVCAKGHNYDYDRKGTLNLLPVQFRKSKSPGDSKDMVLARQGFLNSGIYRPVSDFLNALVLRHMSGDAVLLDAGCGEGYYAEKLEAHLSAHDSPGNFALLGLDISKEAIHEAAKRSRDISCNITWVVGTNAHLPVLDHSVDIVMCLFGFPVWTEFTRVLKPGGVVIMADPGLAHLIELRRVLYPEIHDKDKETPLPSGFVLQGVENLCVKTGSVSRDQLDALMLMTPHGHRATAERREAALGTAFDGLTLDVRFSVYSGV